MLLNVGSGQRKFKAPWINVDCVSRPGQVPDVVADARDLPYEANTASMVVLHHVFEHFHLGEGDGVILEAHRVLRRGCSLIVTVPDMRALAQRWLAGGISDYIYFVNCFGAFQGEPGDDHHWGWTTQSLTEQLMKVAPWSEVKPFDWREIPGADIARDFWICGIEAVK